MQIAVRSQSSSVGGVAVPKELRTQRDTWTPLMDVMKDKCPRVTDEQLERLRALSIENVWGGIQGKGYRACFVTAVVELGGMVDRATFMGTMTGLGMKVRGVKGIVVDGGIRDLSGFLEMKDLPVYYAGAHASVMADQIGVEWNAPVRMAA